MTLAKQLAAETLGTAFLLATVVGSGIMAERLAGGNVALALLANALATGGSLYALILVFAPLCGAHFNPVVSLSAALRGQLSWTQCGLYCLAQVLGAFAGVAMAHLMFELDLYSASTHERQGLAQAWSEAVASFGLMMVILGASRYKTETVAAAVASYIVAAYWFTASTSFANPAVTLARAASNTFSGIRPLDVPAFILAQLIGALAATALFRWFARQETR